MSSTTKKARHAAIDHHIPNLHIEFSEPATAHASVWLQQDQGGTFHNVTLHASQVRLLAEQLGFLAPAGPGADEHRARMSPHAAELERRLHVLHGRIDHLSHMLHYGSSGDHAALEPERIYSLATCEIADAFIADVERPVRVSLAGGGSVAPQENTR